MQTRAFSIYRGVNSYYKWAFKVPFSGQLNIGLQSRVGAPMNHSGQASSEGQPYGSWIRHEVHAARSLIIIHCPATRRAVMLKPQQLLWLPLTLLHGSCKVIVCNKNDKGEQWLTVASWIQTAKHLCIYVRGVSVTFEQIKQQKSTPRQQKDSNLQSCSDTGDNWTTKLLHQNNHTNFHVPNYLLFSPLTAAHCVVSNEPNLLGLKNMQKKN